MLYWLKQEKALSISNIAKAVGKHQGTLQEWLRIYREEGLPALEIVKSKPGGGRRIIPKWAEEAFQLGNGNGCLGPSGYMGLWNLLQESLFFCNSLM